MKVYGHEISDDLAEKAFDAMPANFEACTLVNFLEMHAIPYTSAYRGADRILQKRRKAGEIVWRAGARCWCKQAPPETA